MRILLTNDDGVFAPGLAALHDALAEIGEVVVAAPATEQSGVGHSITYLTPLTCKSIHRSVRGDKQRGDKHWAGKHWAGKHWAGKHWAGKHWAGKHWAWAVDGSPADCVKLSICELFKDNPVDIVVSGINSGLNAGINVLYSGTVAAAIEGAFFGKTSVAVSLEYDEDADYHTAAQIAASVIKTIVAEDDSRGRLFNLNIPTAATRGVNGSLPQPNVVPMGLAQYGRSYEKRTDPGGRDYYWALWSAPENPPPEQADIAQLRSGNVTLTPLDFNLTNAPLLEKMQGWNWAGDSKSN